MKIRLSTLAVGIIGLFILGDLSLYSVDQRQNALVFQLGQVVATNHLPGLYLKLPLVQRVRYFDMRILTLNPPDPDRLITSDKKSVKVEYFTKWRVIDAKQYFVSLGGDSTRAQTQLQQIISDGLRAAFSTRTLSQVVASEREQIDTTVRTIADQNARKIGIQVLDVRIKHIDLPQDVDASVYRRMEAERKQAANELRATGAAAADKIRADADKQREVIIAEAGRDAQQVKGEGDAKASAIYAAAYSKNPEFYAFYRSINAYEQIFSSKRDVLVLDPHSAFFKYMTAPKGDKP